MKYKRLCLCSLIVFLIIPISETLSFTHIDSMKNGNYIFFLTDLEEAESIELNVTHIESGDFTLFLFNKRPIRSYVKGDNTLDSRIFNNHTVAFSLDDNPYINYTASETKIYYIEIILVNGGPDTFTLSSNKDLTRYYLPTIPGYQIWLIIPSIFIVLGLIILIHKKKLIKY
jgi:hypothetical protein